MPVIVLEDGGALDVISWLTFDYKVEEATIKELAAIQKIEWIEPVKMICIKVTLKNDSDIITGFNGTIEEAEEYYFGKYIDTRGGIFRLGVYGDDMQRVSKVEEV